MALADDLVTEFDQEMATTRRVLERVPEDKRDWKPHDKSTSLGSLATHVANLPNFAARVLDNDSIDAANFTRPPAFTTTAALLEFFDRNVREARAKIAAATDDHLGKNWAMLRGGKPFLNGQRKAMLRRLLMSHHIHHRGQLSVYLRLNDVPLPSMYGPTADEPL